MGLENKVDTNGAEPGQKRHYRTLGGGERAPAPGRLLGPTRPIRRDGRCLLAGIFPFSLAWQFGARSGKAPTLVEHPPIPAPSHDAVQQPARRLPDDEVVVAVLLADRIDP